ncbi:hypothetical protein ACN47E_002701 [Coniothyrium glycines]
MSTLALQTKTMLRSLSSPPIKLLGHAAGHDDPNPQLPSKRSRDDVCGLGPFTKPFSIKPHPASPYHQPVVLKPIRVIARAQLPLTFLDTTPDEKFPPNSLFSACIHLLEHDEGSAGPGYSRVLIAQLEAQRTLYAIERVRARVYSTCRLASWLKEKEVSRLWDPRAAPMLASPLGHAPDFAMPGEWWQHAVVETQPDERTSKRVRMTMLRLQPQKQDAVTEEQHAACMPVDPVAVPAPILALPSEPLADLPTPAEQLATLVQQYLDAVYLSKTSLAYFAKGPVTRIRNAFISSEEGAPQTHELVTFLRAMLLSPKAGDKKYYEKLPSTIKSLPPGSYSDEETMALTTKAKKSKKKLTLGRDGLYPHEDLVVKRWWWSQVRSCELTGTETIDQRIKRCIGDLRVRETLAQLIVMLEIIALEKLSTYKPSPEDQVVEGETQIPDEHPPKTKKRKKKLDDISVQLDLLLDKLCIWHATEEAGILDFEANPSKHTENIDASGKSNGNDRLHSFCVEVIIPFYINRLPEQALMVNKKLGGPAHQLPPKRKGMRPPLTSRKSGGSKEPETKKSRRSLARVATDSAGRTMDRVTPSLTRSATDSALLHVVKREVSEVPLSAIPFQRSPSKGARRSMSQMRHLQGRQIDLAQPSAAATAKIKQRQRVEEDLQDAILALKKPNRGLAAGSYAADLEQRALGVTTKSRKPANPVRKSAKEVQVSATPRVGRRTKDMIAQTPNHNQQYDFTKVSAGEAALSSSFWGPSAGAQPSSPMVPATAQRSAAAGRSLVQPGIAETPCKAPNTQSFSSGAVRRTIFATPSRVAGSPAAFEQGVQPDLFATPAKKGGGSPRSRPNLSVSTIAATPTKVMPAAGTRADAYGATARATEDMEPSIYDALGWNENDDDDEV